MADNTKVYAVRAKDRNVLLKSSSGGFFTVLSDLFLDNEDAVCCSIYDYKKKQLSFKIITDKTERDKAIGSKYMPSIPGDIFRECLSFLKNSPEKKLLFIGTGCQAAAFRRFAIDKGIIERIFIADIICHGVPSPKIWEAYSSSLESSANGNIEHLTFKDKRNGWKKPTALVYISGKEIIMNKQLYYNLASIRPSCTKCPYTRIDRSTDLTFGDFWGIENVMPDFYDEKGNSLVLIHSEKGQDAFERIKDSIDFRKSNTKDCLQPNLIRPTPKAKKREEFWKDFQTLPRNRFLEKYGSISFSSKLKKTIKNTLKGLKRMIRK